MRRAIILIFVLLIPPVAAGMLSHFGQTWHYPRRFAEVVPDGLYRGGRPTADNVHQLVLNKGIRRIVNLTDTKDEPEEKDMLAAISSHKLNLIRIPMPGDGVADFKSLDIAADAIADKSKWPVFFHCAAGKQRSNAALAAYRIKYCGCTAQVALAELEEKYDLDTKEERKLCDNIRGYEVWVRGNLARGTGKAVNAEKAGSP
jgi:protein tyrosine/serine phosphatase